MIGRTLGSYAIQRELGRGGMGAVYLGRHALLGKDAAIKVLLPQLSQDHATVQRFFNEARAATAIKHPGIVEIFDVGFDDGAAYIVMELCEGETLAARMRRVRPMPLAASLAIARQVAGALGAAHAAGIVHRDLKPDNVFVVPDPEVAGGERTKLLDFGIAKLAKDAPGVAKTSTGQIIGTPLYMSPEQCRGAGQVDHRADLYALGVMLYEMLCERVPFLGEGAGDVISGHILLAPTAPRELAPSMPAEVEALILGLLAKKPADRPANADLVVAELHRLAGTQPAVIAPAPARDTDADAHAPTLLPSGATTTLGASSAQAIVTTRPRWRARWIALGAVGIACAAAAIAIAVSARSGGGAAPPVPAPVPTPIVTPPLAPAPHAITIVVGPMGGAAAQSAALAALAKAAPEAQVVRAGAPAADHPDPARSFYVDAADLDVQAGGAHVTCSLRVMLSTYADRAVILSINGSAQVSTAASASDLDVAKTDCAQAVVEDLIEKQIVPAMRERLRKDTTVGQISHDAIEAVVKQETPRFTACYQARLGDLPTLQGTIDTTFVIAPDGRVSNAHATGLDPQVAKCVEDVLLTLAFPAPDGGGTTMASYSFVFTSR